MELFSFSLFLSFLDSYSNNFGYFVIVQLMQIQKMSKIITVAV